jgi:hypothetical protein
LSGEWKGTTVRDASGGALRHYTTYFNFDYIGPATVSIPSFVKTHNFDRLTLVTPAIEGAHPQQSLVMRQVMRYLLDLDRRIEHVELSDVLAVAQYEGLRQTLGLVEEAAADYDFVFPDALRSYLFPWAGHPVVWFDTDIIFTGDTSDVFRRPDLTTNAAASDEVSTYGDQSGLGMYHRFVEHVNRALPGTMATGRPARNAGFILLSQDVRASYDQGLQLAVDFVKNEDDPTAPYLIGHLAWNFTLDRHDAHTLDRRYNVPSASLDTPPLRSEVGTEVLARHYMGPDQKKRMIVDYLALHSG